MMHTPEHRVEIPARRRGSAGMGGFTLVELMVSIAIVLLLVIGINEVFRVTGNTIGSGQALSRAINDQRTTKNVMEDDFNNMAADAPCLIITNQAVAAFRDRQDELSNAVVGATDPTKLDLDGNGTISGPGEVVTPATPNSRVHRIDTITFFTRKLTRRQTGNLTGTAPNTYYADLAGSTATAEALVMYGHARQPDNSLGAWFEPGEPEYSSGYKSGKKNDNNKYASQWVLGRRQMVLTPYLLAGGESAWQANVSAGGLLNLTPLSMATQAMSTSTTTVQSASVSAGGAYSNSIVALPWNSYQDLAVTSIAGFARTLGQYERDVARAASSSYTAPANNGLWYLPAGANAFDTTTNQTTQTLVFRPDVNTFGARTDDVTTTGTRVSGTLGATLAQTAPIFIPRCTQFIVEYAGDYLTQVPLPGTTYGDVSAAVPDGVIDYCVYKGQRRVRWYGLPRYTGSGKTTTSAGVAGTNGAVVAGTSSTQAKASNDMPDVVPLADVIAAARGNASRLAADVASFERVLMTQCTSGGNEVSPGSFYSVPNTAASLASNLTAANTQARLADYNAAGAFPLAYANYVCAWRPGPGSGMPKMIRITMTLEDASGQTQPQTFEYIFNVQN